MFDVFLNTALPTLKSLASALRSGRVTADDLSVSLSRILGRSGEALVPAVSDFLASGMTPEHVAVVIDGIVAARTRAGSAADGVDLVLSGPDVPGIPTGDTAATMRRLRA